ncbi:MAG: hypothetical protein OXC46_07140 [Thaumarchaeota archaeon]|nr:hypothetical protein [Nitrososphaerota archaeon]
MMLKFDAGSRGKSVSQTVTIVPRLEYSSDLLSEIIHELEQKRINLKKVNHKMLRASKHDSPEVQDAIDLEMAVIFCLECLSQIRQMLRSVSGIASIPSLLSPAIPAIRTVSAKLYEVMPSCSQKLCELSVHLGSVVLDSAVISTARFDFRQSNYESATLLDEVKLMAYSKINKQYHNLDSFRQQTS